MAYIPNLGTFGGPLGASISELFAPETLAGTGQLPTEQPGAPKLLEQIYSLLERLSYEEPQVSPEYEKESNRKALYNFLSSFGGAPGDVPGGFALGTRASTGLLDQLMSREQERLQKVQGVQNEQLLRSANILTDILQSENMLTARREYGGPQRDPAWIRIWDAMADDERMAMANSLSQELGVSVEDVMAILPHAGVDAVRRMYRPTSWDLQEKRTATAEETAKSATIEEVYDPNTRTRYLAWFDPYGHKYYPLGSDVPIGGPDAEQGHLIRSANFNDSDKVILSDAQEINSKIATLIESQRKFGSMDTNALQQAARMFEMELMNKRAMADNPRVVEYIDDSIRQLQRLTDELLQEQGE